MKNVRFLTGLLAMAAILFITAFSLKALADETPGDTTPAETTGTETPEGEEGGSTETVDISDFAIEYNNFRINCVKGVYFQFVKKEEPGTLKATAWIPAPVSGDRSFIDFSEIKKTSYVAITLDPKATTAGKVITLDFPIKSLKATVNYLAETPQTLYEALALIEVKTIAGATDSLKIDDTASAAATFNGKYSLQWKRGANGTWTDARKSTEDEDDGFAIEYKMLCATSATLYVRVSEYAASTDLVGIIPSKEAKVKIGKTAVPPNIKQDYKKGTLAIKNGMEFVYGDKTYYVPAYSNKATLTGRITSSSSGVNTKVTSVGIEELYTLLKEADNEIAPDTTITIKVRTSATVKKFASWYNELEVKLPIAAPAEEDVQVKFEYCAEKSTLRAEFSVSGAPADGRGIQYALGGADAEISLLKFTDVKKKDGKYLSVGFDARVGKVTEYVTTAGAKDKTKKGEELYLYYRYAPVTTKGSEKYPSLCVKIPATAVEDTSIVLPTEENKPPYMVSFVTTVMTSGIEGGGADVTVGEETVTRATSENGEEIKFKVTAKVVKTADDKERQSEIVVKLSGKILTPDKDGYYTTGTLTKGAVVMIDVTYGDAKIEESPTT